MFNSFLKTIDVWSVTRPGSFEALIRELRKARQLPGAIYVLQTRPGWILGDAGPPFHVCDRLRLAHSCNYR